ncbi:MAG TPA: ATP-binding protein [Nitrospirota bacterium]|nr:ATP-binding protein [Nitrospirota bacterium]
MPFSSLKNGEFIGRQDELSALYKRVLMAEWGQAQSVVLFGHRGIGKSELLKQLFGHLFWKQDRVAPFSYTVNPALLSVAAFSKTYLIGFLCQRLAFLKKEQALLYQDGISIDGLSLLIEESEAGWAKEILDQYIQCAGDPLDSLRIALAAPHRSSLSTGMPVAVLLDDFHWIKGLRIDGVPDARLASLFQEAITHKKTPHIISGNAPELQEMPVVSGLERILVPPLGPEGASARASALLSAYEATGTVPPLLLRHLGGNPFYLGCVVAKACSKSNPDEKDFWNAYIQEIMEGQLVLSWSTVLKGFFPDLGMRRVALAIAYKIHHTAEPLSCQRIAKSFALTDDRAHDVAYNLYLAGIIRGELGVFRAEEDRVLRDVIDCLYLREVLTKSTHELTEYFLAALVPQKGHVARYDMALPMVKEAELIAAQGLEQIGKNLNLNPETIGQLQIAVIEACINAIEYSRGRGDNIYVSVIVDEDQLEVSVESAGPEFIIRETGEPFRDQEAAKGPGRGWGIKLMKRFVDEIEFEKTALGTKIVLIKKIEKSTGRKKESAISHE